MADFVRYDADVLAMVCLVVLNYLKRELCSQSEPALCTFEYEGSALAVACRI